MIPRRRHLFVVGQAGGVAINRPDHAERAGLAGHQLGEIAFVAGDGFRNHDGGVVGGAGHQSLDGVFDSDGLTRAQTEFGGSLVRGVIGDVHFGVELHLAGIEALEQQIERHDLGERRRMAAGVGIGGGERGAGVAVYDDGGERRVVTLPRFLVVARIMSVPGVARICSVVCENDRSGGCNHPDNASPQNPRGSQGCAKHKLPRPIMPDGRRVCLLTAPDQGIEFRADGQSSRHPS